MSVKLTAVFRPPHPVSAEIDAAHMSVTMGTPVVKEYVDAEPYMGAYEVTPSEATQTLATFGKRMINNVTIHPIPSNYGRIEYNGAVLTVS